MKHNYRQGIFKPTHPEIYRGSQPIIFRSGMELKMFQICDSHQNILTWGSESVVLPYLSPLDGRMHKYFIDLVMEVKLATGGTQKFIVEIKPYKQTLPPVQSSKKKSKTILYETIQYQKNMSKWTSAKEWAAKKGYKFIIVTENELKTLTNLH